MSIGTIFPIMWSTTPLTESVIISHCDVDTRLFLSQVNKTAQKIINNEHFKLFFCERFSKMSGSPNLLKNLFYFHPNICWKVACYALSHPQFFPRSPIFFDDPSKHLPVIREECAQLYKEICGKGGEDPESPINRAWIAYQGAGERLNTWTNRYVEAFTEMVTLFQQESGQRRLLGEVAMQVITFIHRLPPKQRTPERFEEELQDSARQFDVQKIDDDIYQWIFNCYEKTRDNPLNEIESEYKKLGRSCMLLTSAIEECEVLPKTIQSDLQHFSEEGSEPIQLIWKLDHYNALVEEMAFARTMECKNFNDKDTLLELHILTNLFVTLKKNNKPVPYQSKQFHSLPVLLDSCSCRDAILSAFQGNVTAKRGEGAWQESLLDNIRRHLKIFEKVIQKQRQGFIALDADFSKSLQHPCRTIVPSWNEQEQREIWEQKMRTFLNSLLPESYLNHPERRQTLFEIDKLFTETIPEHWIDEVVNDIYLLSRQVLLMDNK